MIRMLIIYLIVINLIGLIEMGIDKRKAVRKEWRIPEKVLFGVAIIGGALGSITGMYLFHHKTRHLTFVIGMPLILGIHIVLGLVWLI